jgi:protein STE50
MQRNIFFFLNQSVSATSATPSKFPARLDIRASIDNPCHKILSIVLKDYGVYGNTSQYNLRIIYWDKHRDHEKALEDLDRPQRIFKQLEKEGKKPMFTLRNQMLPVL